MEKSHFTKYGSAPVFGDESTGTVFDAYVRPQADGKLRMDFSWRPQKSLALTYSDDGIHWTDPVITLSPNPESGWEDRLNRNCVLYIPEQQRYLMWYTGQANEHSWIGVAESKDGVHFERFRKDYILAPETDFEGASVMNPFVMYENGKFRMWYAAGETYEPNVICYAESDDGVHFVKHAGNPIFTCAPENPYEQNRIGACDILKDGDSYLMFYIGYRDIHTACICAARSADGITGWVRVPQNPILLATPGAWDEDSCYKPTILQEADGTIRLWYNGRSGQKEYIGYAYGKL